MFKVLPNHTKADKKKPCSSQFNIFLNFIFQPKNITNGQDSIKDGTFTFLHN
jgi:hypothetical protein